MKAAAELPPPSLRDRGQPRLLVTCHRRENWGDGLSSVAAALCQLADSGTARIDVMLHPNPHLSGRIEQLLGGARQLPCCHRAGHSELAASMRECDLMLSDSGGVQEEAPALGVPLLVLRDKTERPEALWTGNLRLVGTDTDRIVGMVRDLLDDPVALSAMAEPSLPYGDGRAGYRIAALIEQWRVSRAFCQAGRLKRLATQSAAKIVIGRLTMLFRPSFLLSCDKLGDGQRFLDRPTWRLAVLAGALAASPASR